MLQSSRSVLPAAAAADSELARLRAVRADLMERRAEIDRELNAVGRLIAAYVSYQPQISNRGEVVTRSSRTRNVRSTVLDILISRPYAWLTLHELLQRTTERLPEAGLSELQLRSALWHLIRTGLASSRQTDDGIQFSAYEPDSTND